MRPKVSGSSGSSITSPSTASGFSSTASVMAIWCAGSSCSSSGTTVQRRNALYSPDSRSISTRTSTSSLKRFLVAEASAISSARNTVSFATFFSRERASTRRRRSLLMFPMPPKPSHVRHQPGAVDVCEFQMLPLSLDVEHDPAVLDSHQSTLEAPASVARQLQLHARFATREALEILEPLERPVEPRRRHLQALVIDAFDGERAREMVAHAGAVLDVYAAGRIDEDPHEPRARRLHVHKLVAEALEGLPNPRITLRKRFHKQKMGAKPISHFPF